MKMSRRGKRQVFHHLTSIYATFLKRLFKVCAKIKLKEIDRYRGVYALPQPAISHQYSLVGVREEPQRNPLRIESRKAPS